MEIRPSKMPGIMACSGRLQATAGLPPEPPSQDAIDGTICHAYCAGESYDPATITDEMRDASDIYTGYIKRVTGGYNEGLQIETRVEIPQLHPGCGGTPDTSWYHHRLEHLHIFDLKFGHGLVEAFQNWQMLCYAVGLVTETTKLITLHIIQPRVWHPEGSCRSWTLTPEQLQGYLLQMRTALAAALQVNPVCTTGPHCRNCRALLICNTAWQAVTWAIQFAENLDLSEATPEMIGPKYAILKNALSVMEKLFIILDETGIKLMKEGKLIPGIGHTRTRGSTKWKVPPENLFAVGDMMGINLKKETVLTPNQAIQAGLPADTVKGLSEKIPGRLKLKIDDGREALRIFQR